MGTTYDGFYANTPMPAIDYYVGYLYIHDGSRDLITAVDKAENWVVEHNYLERSGDRKHPDNHGQTIMVYVGPTGSAQNLTFRYNTIADCNGTGAIVMLGGAKPGESGSSFKNIHVYGNTFFSTDKEAYMYSPGAVYARDSTKAKSVFVYNNTFYNVRNPATFMNNDPASGNLNKNNVYVNCYFQFPYLGVESSSNYYFNNTGQNVPKKEVGLQNGTADPFVNAAAHDFRLKAATDGGSPLPQPYDKDPLDQVRGADGVWDRGAYEYKK